MAPTTKKTGTGAAKTAKTDKKTPERKKPAKKPVKPAETMPENIWEKLPTENVNQYAQFAAYRDMAYKGGAEAVIKMREDHALLGAQMIRKAPAAPPQNAGGEISAGDLVRLADVGVKIERLSRGESTENQSVSGKVEHEGTVKVSVETQANLKDLSDEELGQLEQRHRVHQRRPHSRKTATGAGNKADIKQEQCKYCADNNLKLYQHQ